MSREPMLSLLGIVNFDNLFSKLSSHSASPAPMLPAKRAEREAKTPSGLWVRCSIRQLGSQRILRLPGACVANWRFPHQNHKPVGPGRFSSARIAASAACRGDVPAAVRVFGQQLLSAREEDASPANTWIPRICYKSIVAGALCSSRPMTRQGRPSRSEDVGAISY